MLIVCDWCLLFILCLGLIVGGFRFHRFSLLLLVIMFGVLVVWIDYWLIEIVVLRMFS